MLGEYAGSIHAQVGSMLLTYISPVRRYNPSHGILDRLKMEYIKNILSWNNIQSSHRLMLLSVFVLGVLSFFWGEKVPAGGGFGWDGVIYAKMVRNLNGMISDGQLSSYYAQRILPSAIVRSMLILSKTSMTDINIIRCFEIYNLSLLVGAVWIWKRIADNFSLSLSGRWIGFSGIFVNYQCSKQAFYYPVLTDVTALFVGMLLLLFYIEKKPIALFIVTIIGAFCWPIVSVCGAMLLIFLRAELPKAVLLPVAFDNKSLLFSHFVKLIGSALLVLSIIGYLIFTKLVPVSEQACSAFNNQLQTLMNVIPANITSSYEWIININNPCVLENWIIKLEQVLTALPSVFGALVAILMLIGSWSFVQSVASNLWRAHLPLVALAILAVLIPILIIKLISNPSVTNPSSLMLLIKLILLPQEGKVLLPIVTLAVFWGPVVVLLLLYWKAFCIEARKLGVGVVAVLGISLPFGLVGEPRFMTVAWPFLVLGIVLALELSNKKASFKYVFAALTILYAQFWMKLNLAPWIGGDSDGLQEFPKQIYFMHYGLWMSWVSYLIQLFLIIISTLWLKRVILPFK